MRPRGDGGASARMRLTKTRAKCALRIEWPSTGVFGCLLEQDGVVVRRLGSNRVAVPETDVCLDPGARQIGVFGDELDADEAPLLAAAP